MAGPNGGVANIAVNEKALFGPLNGVGAEVIIKEWPCNKRGKKSFEVTIIGKFVTRMDIEKFYEKLLDFAVDVEEA